MNDSVKCVCIGHRPPLFAPPLEYVMLTPQRLGMKNEIVVDDGRFGLNFDGGSLAEYSQLFGLCDLVAAGDFNADYLYLFQYRKFISPVGWEQVSPDTPWLKHAPLEWVEQLFPRMEYLRDFGATLACGPMIDLTVSISDNYSRWHHPDDFSLFCAACGESGVLTAGEIFSFVTFRGLIPSPALTIVKADVFVELMSKLKRVWSVYARSGFLIPREGYQRRASGYLLERLHSELAVGMVRSGLLGELSVWERFLVPGQEPG